jgi:hypothetical protein
VVKGKDLAISLVILMKVLIEILEGGEIEDNEYVILEDYFTGCGYDKALLNDMPLVGVLQIICKDFSKLNLEEYWVENNELIEKT